jgi:hypothetical protein
MHACITLRVSPVCTRSCAQRNTRSKHKHTHTSLLVEVPHGVTVGAKFMIHVLLHTLLRVRDQRTIVLRDRLLRHILDGIQALAKPATARVVRI